MGTVYKNISKSLGKSRFTCDIWAQWMHQALTYTTLLDMLTSLPTAFGAFFLLIWGERLTAIPQPIQPHCQGSDNLQGTNQPQHGAPTLQTESSKLPLSCTPSSRSPVQAQELHRCACASISQLEKLIDKLTSDWQMMSKQPVKWLQLSQRPRGEGTRGALCVHYCGNQL